MPQIVDLSIDSVDRSEMLRYMGYAGQEYDPSLDQRIDQAIARAIEVSRPRASIDFFDVESREVRDDGTPVLRLRGTSIELAGHSMEEHMADAVAVGVLAVTLGMGDERELHRLGLTDHVGQILLDSASTTLVERAADAAESLIVAEATRRGLYTNFRFSPGYGDLPLSIQPTILSALDATRRLGITLSPTLLMTPTKSVTAVVGMCTRPQASTRRSCKGCPCFDFCTIRPTGRTCHG